MADQDPQATASNGAPDAAPEEAASAERIEALERELAEARQKAEDNWDQFLRARAELDNLRRRSEREVEQAHKFALEKFAAELLGVRDSLELGSAAAHEPGADVARVREGLDLTLRLLSQTMEKFRIVEVNPAGEKFDPTHHEAMAAQESDEHEPNTVLQVVQKGYLLNDRLLRPAMVVVSRPGVPPQGGVDEKA